MSKRFALVIAFILVGIGVILFLVHFPSFLGNKNSTSYTSTSPLNAKRDLNGEHLIGAWYFAGWWKDPLPAHYMHAGRDWRTQYPEREPVIGWFDDTQQALDQEITLASEGGVNFFAFDWYTKRDTADKGYPGSLENLNNGLKFFLSSPNKTKMKFIIAYVNSPNFAISSELEWQEVTDRWISYFKDPQYLKIDNKPVLIILDAGTMDQQLGGTVKMEEAFNQIQAKAQGAGFSGILIGGGLGDPGQSGETAKKLAKEGFNFFVGNYASHGPIPDTTSSIPYGSLLNWAPAYWQSVSSLSPIPYIPVVNVGWDRRPVIYKEEGYFINRSPKTFGELLEKGKEFISDHPLFGQKILMIYAWNEIGEGGELIPTKADGDIYLNQVKTMR